MKTSKTIVFARNATHAKYMNPDKEIRRTIADIVSYKVAAAEHAGVSNWDGYSSFYDKRKDTFDAGFLGIVKKRLERAGHKVIIKQRARPEPLGPESPVVDSYPEDPRYDYQAETMNRLVKMGGMIAQVATGGGKSRIFKLCAERINRPTLFITTRKSLMYQMAETYEKDIGKNFGIMGDGIWRPCSNGVNFAIVDTLVSRLEKLEVRKEMEKAIDRVLEKADKEADRQLKKRGLPTNTRLMRNMPKEIVTTVEKVKNAVYDRFLEEKQLVEDDIRRKVETHNQRRLEVLELLQGIEFLCIEEAHEASGNGFYNVAMACKNAYYRLALTATPFMKDDEEANMRLMAVAGPVGIKVSEKLLIDRGILATPYFKILKSKAPTGVMRGTPWQKAYSLGVVNNTARNLSIVKEAQKAKAFQLPIMILVQQTKHGDVLKKLLTTAGVKARFISGKNEQEERADALKALGRGDIDCLIGSTILDVGVDVPAVGLVVLAGGGKAEVAIRQRIGRGLRAKKSGPNVAFILDFNDNFNNHLSRHSMERLRILSETPGFAERVSANDFDYEGLGLRRA